MKPLNSAVGRPASRSGKIALICTSVNLILHVVRLLPVGDGLYPKIEEIANLRSFPLLPGGRLDGNIRNRLADKAIDVHHAAS